MFDPALAECRVLERELPHILLFKEPHAEALACL